jgi:hypothetical protein
MYWFLTQASYYVLLHLVVHEKLPKRLLVLSTSSANTAASGYINKPWQWEVIKSHAASGNVVAVNNDQHGKMSTSPHHSSAP